jgi:YihY family inner membrane protein
MFERWVTALDRMQQRHSALAVVVGVVRKFSDDGAGRLAVVVAYYGFFSIFPLLLVFVTISSWFIADRPDVQERLLDSALAQFPIIGDSIRDSIGQVDGSGLAFVIGLLIALWGGLGAVQAMQAAMNVVWDVAPRRQPSFLAARLRSLGLVAALGLGVVATAASSALVGAVGGVPMVSRVALVAVTFLVTFALFVVTFRLLTVARIRWRDVVPGAAVSAAGWVVLQAFGAALLSRQLRDASALYGFFGIVIGLLWWMYLLAQVSMLGAELNVVLLRHLWPTKHEGEPCTSSLGHARPQGQQGLPQDS